MWNEFFLPSVIKLGTLKDLLNFITHENLPCALGVSTQVNVNVCHR